jgi:long-chain fatty acid transport protein
MKKIALLSLVASSVLLAGGYKIPENSTNAVALGAANVAHNHNSADAAYYNPAKMVFMSDENHIDANLVYIGLDSVDYEGTQGVYPASGSSESEDFFIPSLHYVSPKLGDNGARVGLSIVSPGGLSKRWEGGQVASATAEEFTLQTIEINPTAAFRVNDTLSVGVGFRIVYSSGVAKGTPVPDVIYQNLEGDSLDFGYNLALAYQPTEALEFGLTYRSKINLALDGDADLAYPGNGTTIPALPAGTYDASITFHSISGSVLERTTMKNIKISPNKKVFKMYQTIR